MNSKKHTSGTNYENVAHDDSKICYSEPYACKILESQALYKSDLGFSNIKLFQLNAAFLSLPSQSKTIGRTV